MPSQKVLEKKQVAVEEFAEKIKASVAGVVVDYKGINVADDTRLRRELREAGIEYAVVKNSILRRACDKADFSGLNANFVGTTAIAISKEDPVAAARILSKFSEASKDKLKIKAGFVEGRVLDKAEVDALAKLPSREELVAKVLYGLNAPISGFANVLNANLRGLAIVINAIAEKKAG